MFEDSALVESSRDGIVVSSDPARLDVDSIHGFLTESYWSRGISLETVRRSLGNSLCFGAYDGASQIGFARVITDAATWARLMDVYVIESHRGRGLGKWLVELVLDHPLLQRLKAITLGTADAQGLYRRFGFRELADPSREMWKRHSDPFGRRAPSPGGAGR